MLDSLFFSDIDNSSEGFNSVSKNIDSCSKRISDVSREVSDNFTEYKGEYGQIFIEASDIRMRLHDVLDKNSPIENIGKEIVNMISKIIEKAAGPLFYHMECVEHASTWIARKLNLSEESISNISTAAYFHDFGKLWLPYRPWEIDGPLNAKQYSKMKAHPVLGETKLTGILPDSVLQIIARHHKRHDGSGYPKNLDPCFESSILHVADSLVVMATRNYNGDRDHLFTREESSKELKNLKGSDFHPEIAEVAEELLHEIEYVPYRSVA